MYFEIETRYKRYIHSLQSFKFLEHLVQILTWRRGGLPPINLTNKKTMKKELVKDSKSVFKKGESKMPKISFGGLHIKLFLKDL